MRYWDGKTGADRYDIPNKYSVRTKYCEQLFLFDDMSVSFLHINSRMLRFRSNKDFDWILYIDVCFNRVHISRWEALGLEPCNISCQETYHQDVFIVLLVFKLFWSSTGLNWFSCIKIYISKIHASSDAVKYKEELMVCLLDYLSIWCCYLCTSNVNVV